ncbi:MAG: DHHW family protein [Oscillospiraceae bacterium]
MGIVSVFAEKPTISDAEKRKLSTMPKFTVESFFKGEFARDFELFYADTFPGRDVFIKLAAEFDKVKGITLDNIRLHQGVAPTPDSSTNEALNSEQPITSNTSETDAERENNAAYGEQIGSSFVYKGMALPIFVENPPAGIRYANVIGKYKEALGDSVKVYNLIIPSSIEFYLPKKYSSVTTPQEQNIKTIYSHMSKDIITVDAYSAISQNTDDYLYFRTDHHWTARGAYCAYTAFAESAGFAPVSLQDFTLKTLPNTFLGSLYSQTNDQSLTKNPDTLEYFVPKTAAYSEQYRPNSPYYPIKTTVFAEYAHGSNSYCVFLHGDLPLTHIVTEQKNGKSIAIVKESFGNAFVPFLINHYQDIYVVDQRYFQLGLVDFIKNNQIDELLFINNIFAAQTDIRINEINRIMYQAPYIAPPVSEEVPVEEAPSEENTPTETIPEAGGIASGSTDKPQAIIPDEEEDLPQDNPEHKKPPKTERQPLKSAPSDEIKPQNDVEYVDNSAIFHN